MTDDLLPDDPHDQALVDHVHPADWEAPEPADRYNLVVIGGGPAGLVAALGAAGMGAKVALVERHLLGGDCLNHGCVPSKALLRAAHAAHAARDAARFGVSVGDVQPDFAAIMERLRKIRADIGPHDSAERLKRDGIDVFLGNAQFTGPDTLDVDGTTLRFRRACIATGARPALPPIPGIEDVGAITNQHLFTLTELPPRLTVVGAGVIGCEMAQAFARLGSAVTLIDQADRILTREAPDAAALVQEQLVADGVTLKLGVGVERFERGEARTTVLNDGERIDGDCILVAVGRRPNLDLNLEAAGVETTERGIRVDSHLVTTNPDIYAAGDVIGQGAFTHAADFHARIVVRNALFFGHARVDDLIIPRVTYTHPEIAAVGVTGAEAETDESLTAFRVEMDETDRGRTDSESGYCRVWADSKGRIRGAVIVAEHAGELLAPVTLAMTQGISLSQIADTIHPYPTRSEVVFKVASAYNRTRVTPTVKKAATWLLDWRR
jgi:pyruvate/2-oxoglutarate dehydrogenase complex dihydrolipoamide dehydrogenase (E3) component